MHGRPGEDVSATDGKIKAEVTSLTAERWERTVAPWSEFQGGSESGDVLAFQPHLIADTIGYRDE